MNKCMWWMPWRLQAMKDVVACEKLRGAGKRALIRRCPNGETHSAMSIPQGRQTWRTETSKYPEEKKSTEISLVVTSEKEAVQWLSGNKLESSGNMSHSR